MNKIAVAAMLLAGLGLGACQRNGAGNNSATNTSGNFQTSLNNAASDAGNMASTAGNSIENFAANAGNAIENGASATMNKVREVGSDIADGPDEGGKPTEGSGEKPQG